MICFNLSKIGKKILKHEKVDTMEMVEEIIRMNRVESGIRDIEIVLGKSSFSNGR